MGKAKRAILEKLPRSGRACAGMLAITLLAFWSMTQLGTWWTPPLNSIVFAVMLGVMLQRALQRVGLNKLPVAAATFAVGTAAAVGCGMLIEGNSGLRALGAVLFAAGVALPVWARRFGGIWKATGTVFTMPFMAILVHPVPLEQSAGFFGWELIAAAIAFAWAAILKVLENAHAETSEQADSPTTEKTSKLPSSTKMAIQLAVAIVAAFVCAQLVDADHLVWPVLTVLIVHSGNNGRGDILWKGVQRTAGALVGATIASLVAINLAPQESLEIVAIFAILAFAAAVREYSYLFWAACIPAALVFLYSFFGQSGAELAAHLAHRLLGIALGSAIGIASGYFLLPIRVVDVVRLRLGALLSTAGGLAVSAAKGEAGKPALEELAREDAALSHFDGVTRAARYYGLGVARRLNGAIVGAHALACGLQSEAALQDRASLAALAKEIGAARKTLSPDAAVLDLQEPDTANPLIESVRAITDARLGQK